MQQQRGLPLTLPALSCEPDRLTQSQDRVPSSPGAQIDGVHDVHDLHVWNLSLGLPILSAHVNLEENSQPDAVGAGAGCRGRVRCRGRVQGAGRAQRAQEAECVATISIQNARPYILGIPIDSSRHTKAGCRGRAAWRLRAERPM